MDQSLSFLVASPSKAVRTQSFVVRWHDVIWFGGNISRHSFIVAWLTVSGYLLTRDSRGDVLSSGSCVLCDGSLESKDHLLFECSFGVTL